MKKERSRADQLVVERGLAPSREKARALIMAGKVLAADRPVSKAGEMLAADVELRVRGGQSRYVSRGGDKMEGALADLNIPVAGRRALDCGASTGGFTDCLLQHGAERVHAIDVGRAQIAESLRNDPRVVVREKVNARLMAPGDFDCHFDVITADVSFISLLKVLPALESLLAPGGDILALIKPQFEAGKGRVGKGGVVRDPEIHIEVIVSVSNGASALGLFSHGVAYSHVPGPKGNIEYFIHLRKQPPALQPSPYDEIVRAAFENLCKKEKLAGGS